ncbi:hemophore-related protein [Mycolicibacterium sp. P1-5]|uniref:hemophore-related protein n=1 Tax=Mycolicibacterium sp. P1-5 TaxID=2024617 RepID=UPI0011EEF812|nr:hemophore-related protein [Mycolicibacterium sp. P1-5]KAA0107766.1 hemophore-related protein [Mycolicibacterium sp. P1-5]
MVNWRLLEIWQVWQIEGPPFMNSAQRLRRVVVAGSLAAAIALSSASVSSADPIMDALANTSCTYPQVTAALDAEAPALGRQLSARPDMQANIQQFLAMPMDQRQHALAQQQAANPQLNAMIYAQIGPQITQVANTCMNY